MRLTVADLRKRLAPINGHTEVAFQAIADPNGPNRGTEFTCVDYEGMFVDSETGELVIEVYEEQ